MLVVAAEFPRMAELLDREAQAEVAQAFLAQRELLEQLILVAGAAQAQMLAQVGTHLAAQAAPASSSSSTHWVLLRS
jgi:hypothetical protein